MKRLLAAATLAACLGLAGHAEADMAQADGLYNAGSYEEAFAAYAELARDEDGQAMLRMAQMFEAGEGVAPSRTRALTWYRRAAAHDIAAAYFRLGEMYESGIGVPRDYAAAVRAYRAAADLGDVPAMIRLANLYVDGSGAMPDTSEAARLLKQAADSGDADAVAALERLVASGTVPRNTLDDLGIPPPPPPSLPTVEELAAQGMAEQETESSYDAGASASQDAGGSSSSAGVETAMAEESTPIEESAAAAQLRSAINANLETFNGSEEASLDYGLDIAESDDGAMVATVRGLRMASTEGTWEMGEIVYDLTPVGEATYDVTVAVPAATTFYDDHGMAVGGTSIGSQDIHGTWNIALNLWTSGFVDMRDVTMTMAQDGENPFDLTVAAITGDSAMDDQGDGKWRGATRFTLDGIAFGGGDGEVGSIDAVNVTMDQRAVDYIFFQALQMARTEFEGRFGPMPDFNDKTVQAALQDLARPVLALARERSPLVGDLGGGIEILGLEGTDPESGAPFRLERLSMAMSAYDLDTALGTVNIAFEHSGFAMTVDGTAQRYLPSDGAFIVTVRDVPVEDSAAMALEMFEGGLDDPAAFQDNAMMALTFLGLGMQQSMAATGTTLEIENIAYVSQALTATMKGALTVDAASPLGATGTVTLEIEGLDAAVADVSAQKDDPDAQEILMPLTMLQAMGQRVEDGGTVRHVYVVELTADGRTLLNGTDMGPMMDGMMGGGETTYQ